jgi:hypothetical protein
VTAISYIEFVMGELDEGDSPRVYVAGITGTARITPGHAFILDYELGS